MTRPELDKKINEYLKGEKFENILDVGGTKGTYKLLKKKFPSAKIKSINISKKELPKENGIIANAEELPFGENSFNLIFVREVLEHLYRPDRFLKEIKRVSKDSAKIILSTPNLNSWHIRLLILFGYPPTNYTPYPGKVFGLPKIFKTKAIYDHIRVFPFNTLKEIFNKNNFKLEKIEGVMTYSEKVWLKNYRKFIGKLLPNKWKEGIVLKSKITK